MLGVAWDGTGYGTDGTIWGGEFLQATGHGFDRMAQCLSYYLPGAAAFEMTDLSPMQYFTRSQLVIPRKMMTQKINTPVTSSIGCMFNGVASLLNLHHYVSFEGQAARTVEFAATQSPVRGLYPFVLVDTQPVLIDWRPMIKAMVRNIQCEVMTPVVAAKFHNTLTEIIIEVSC